MACKNLIKDENQLAAMTKRTKLHTLSMRRDSIDLSNTLNKPFAVISLEFLKFFGRVDWNLIFYALRTFG